MKATDKLVLKNGKQIYRRNCYDLEDGEVLLFEGKLSQNDLDYLGALEVVNGEISIKAELKDKAFLENQSKKNEIANYKTKKIEANNNIRNFKESDLETTEGRVTFLKNLLNLYK